ncbi:hypothetical protein ES702_06825 [subsurface metagenome]
MIKLDSYWTVTVTVNVRRCLSYTVEVKILPTVYKK